MKLLEHGIISVGDVQEIEDRVRYPTFFREYKKRHSGEYYAHHYVMASLQGLSIIKLIGTW